MSPMRSQKEGETRSWTLRKGHPRCKAAETLLNRVLEPGVRSDLKEGNLDLQLRMRPSQVGKERNRGMNYQAKGKQTHTGKAAPWRGPRAAGMWPQTKEHQRPPATTTGRKRRGGPTARAWRRSVLPTHDLNLPPPEPRGNQSAPVVLWHLVSSTLSEQPCWLCSSL